MRAMLGCLSKISSSNNMLKKIKPLNRAVLIIITLVPSIWQSLSRHPFMASLIWVTNPALTTSRASASSSEGVKEPSGLFMASMI